MKAESFGFKNAWLAAKGVSPQAVAEALSLRDARAGDWAAGLAAAYEYPISCSVFVSPPLDGWVLSVGFPLFALADARPPAFGIRAAELAARLQTEVQYFSTHRIVEAHAWARALPGGLERAYEYVGESGETVLNVGALTPDERALGFAFFDPNSSDADVKGHWDREDPVTPSESHVMMLAARWSIDPSSLTERGLDVGEGLIGDFGPPPAGPAPVVDPARPWWKVW